LWEFLGEEVEIDLPEIPKILEPLKGHPKPVGLIKPIKLIKPINLADQKKKKNERNIIKK